jgi:hypothetical protein
VLLWEQTQKKFWWISKKLGLKRGDIQASEKGDWRLYHAKTNEMRTYWQICVVPQQKAMSVVSMKTTWNQPLHKTITDKWVRRHERPHDEKFAALANAHGTGQKIILLRAHNVTVGKSDKSLHFKINITVRKLVTNLIIQQAPLSDIQKIFSNPTR